MTTGRKFTKKNDGFTCENCLKEVPQAKKTCRNHCPFCLHSKHVDRFPGDRANTCGGLLKPVGYFTNGKKGLVLQFKCQRCLQEGTNRSLIDDEIQADDYEKILDL